MTLIGIYLADTQALAMLVLGVALGIQASAALAYSRRSLARHSTQATLLLLGGSALAAATGLAAFSAGVAANISSSHDDPECGPLAIGLLVGARHRISPRVHTSEKSESALVHRVSSNGAWWPTRHNAQSTGLTAAPDHHQPSIWAP